MKKVILVTLQGANIGNRLQNYALQKILEQFNCEVFTPYYNIKELDTVKDRAKIKIKSLLGWCGVKKYRNTTLMMKRIKCFKEFDKEYISNRFKITFGNIDSKEYDYAVTGSDQVWHGWFDTNEELNYFYLQFISKEKRIAYAPSFGFEQFPKERIEIHKKGIEGIEALSCREKKGAELICDLTGRQSVLVLDPSLLLTRSEWERIEKKPSYILPERYILVYFLGNKSEAYKKSISDLAQESNLEVIDIFDTEYNSYYFTKPDEFIWLIHRAKYVCTDSFHACVFSIIFHKNFMIFKRSELNMEKMFNRIEDILDAFSITNRVYCGNIEPIKEEYECDSIIELQSISRNFIKNALRD